MSRRLLPLLLIALTASAAPRPINEAERAAVAIVAKFLHRGPSALHAALTPDAPLRALPHDQAIAEIAARTGPVKGATWRLQTSSSDDQVAFHVTFASGYDDALLLTMKETGRGWLLHDLRTIGEPVEQTLLSAPSPTQTRVSAVHIAILAFLLVLALLATRKRIRFAGTALIAFGALLLVAVAARMIPQKRTLPFIELRDAAPLREALARGDSAAIPERLSTEARAVALLWVLQSGHAAMIEGTTANPFAGLGLMSSTPLGYLVRARTAGNRDDAAAALQDAAGQFPARDDVLAEAASTTGKDEYLQRMIELGSRDAATWYAEARRAVAGGQMKRAKEAFRTAWDLEPLPREELLRDQRLTPLLQDVEMQLLIGLFDAKEPMHVAKGAGRESLPLPPNAEPFLLGDLLRITIGGATLEVPGGGPFAPRTARVVSASYRQRERDAAALRDAEWLVAHPKTIRRTSPVREARALYTLAVRHRWNDILTLTEDAKATMPLITRIHALVRLDRRADAQALAGSAAVRNLMQSRRDPSTLLFLGDTMSWNGSHDTAASLYAAARGSAWEKQAAERLKRAELRRELLTSGNIIDTAHFKIRYLDPISHYAALQFGARLEAELAALQQRLPAVAFKPVVVNVLRESDLHTATGSNDILGQYDGELVVPLDNDSETTTHELAHAVIVQLTGNNAPRWFQEGMARRLSTSELPHPQRLLPVALLDPFLEYGFDETGIRDGYDVAHAFIVFLETRYGAGATVALIREFAAGRTTEEALANATGKSVAALDAEFRATSARTSAGS